MLHNEIAKQFLHETDRVAVFIDGSNISAISRSAGFPLDFKRIREWFLATGISFVRFGYYTAALSREKENELGEQTGQINNLIDWLSYNGYRCHVREGRVIEIKDTKDETKVLRRIIKGNIDTDLSIDMVLLALSGNVNHIILFSGDGDYARAVEVCQQNGVKVTAAATIRGDFNCTSDSLRRLVDHFVDIMDLQKEWERRRDVKEA